MRIKPSVITIAGLLVLGSASIYEEKESRQKAKPPAGVTNLFQFLEIRTNIKYFRAFHLAGKPFIELQSKPGISVLSYPSGPPAYIFDCNGVLVDWTFDRGDATGFERKWGLSTNLQAFHHSVVLNFDCNTNRVLQGSSL